MGWVVISSIVNQNRMDDFIYVKQIYRIAITFNDEIWKVHDQTFIILLWDILSSFIISFKIDPKTKFTSLLNQTF